jgi:short chain dehydrogenase
VIQFIAILSNPNAAKRRHILARLVMLYAAKTSLVHELYAYGIESSFLPYLNPRYVAMKNKIALVTGANKGLGFETCLQLAQLGLTVILSARDFIKGEIAAKQLADKGLDVLFFQLDVSNQSNISRIAHHKDT